VDIPQDERAECQKCGGEVVRGRTSRKSKGEWVVVTLDAAEDTVGDSPGTQWVVTTVGGTYTAGQPGSKNQRAGMIAAGYKFHQEHAKTCAKRYAQGKRPRGRR
jgi:hypothetical protein